MSVSGGWKGFPAQPRRPLNLRPRIVKVGRTLSLRTIPAYPANQGLTHASSGGAGDRVVEPLPHRLDLDRDAGVQSHPAERIVVVRARQVVDVGVQVSVRDGAHTLAHPPIDLRRHDDLAA